MFECYAAGPRRRLDLELSAGSNPLTPTADYGRKLAWGLGYRYSLGVQIKFGQRTALIFKANGTTTRGTLQLPAIKTTSLIEAGHKGVPALHLAAKPIFRVSANGPNSISPDGLLLGRAIAEAISG